MCELPGALQNRGRARRRLDRLKARRRGWLKVHRYLGVVLGGVLTLIGLTGSALVFWQELDAWLNPELAYVDVPSAGSASARPLDEIVAAADAAMPAGAKSSFIYAPRSAAHAVWFFYDGPKAADGAFDTLNVFVDPYSAKVTGTRIWYHAHDPLQHCFVGFLFKLHYALLLGRTGAALVGFLGVFLVVSILSGLILWWPLGGNWRQALSFRLRAGSARFHYDLHKTAGFWLLPVLLALAVSGVSFNLPAQFRWLVERFSPVDASPPMAVLHLEGRKHLSVAEAVERIRRDFPDEHLYWFSVPTAPDTPYVFTFQTAAGGVFTGRHQLSVDPYSGVILDDKSPVAGSGGRRFMQWQWPLHSGHVLGMPGRLAVLAAGIACLLLFVTGLTRWLQKRKAARAMTAETPRMAHPCR